MGKFAFAIHCKRGTIEYQLILSTYQIDINEGNFRFADTLSYYLVTRGSLAHVVRGCIQHNQHGGSRTHSTLYSVLFPDIGTNINAEFYPVQFEYAGIGACLEITPFIENRVIGKLMLEICGSNFAVDYH